MKDFRWYNCFLRDWVEVQTKMDETGKAWNHFMSGNVDTENGYVSAEVKSSWMRCKEKGLDPYDSSIVSISQMELKQRIDENKKIIDIMEPIIHEIIEVMIRALTRIDFYDKDLFLIAQFGGPKDFDIESLGVRKLRLGDSGKEQDCGTTSTNLAAILGRPIELRGREHYRNDLFFLHDASAPIMHQNGTLMGVLTMEAGCWPLHKYTLATLILLKRQIENFFKGNSQTEAVELIRNINNELIEGVDQAVLFADANGRIAGANEKAKSILFNNRPNVSGFFCETVLGQRNAFSVVMNNKQSIVDQDFLLNNFDGSPKMYTGSIKPIMGQNGKVQGVLGFFDKKKNTSENNSNIGTKANYNFNDIVYKSDKMKQVIILAKESAKIQSNVLIQGESGTGKEIFAQAIHNNSPFASGPFMAINCSAIPHGLLESELFGYEGGSYTGSKKEGCVGKFEIATGGTVFLDEINSMPLDMQVKILRTIQQKSVIRVGGVKEIPINVRIIAASNTNLCQMVQRGEFREDLYYRINIIGITIPPLRERKEDIERLTYHILNKISYNQGHYFTISEQVIQLLLQYDWPGNVRELENVLERSVVMAQTKNVNFISEEDVLSYPKFQKQTDYNSELSNEIPSTEIKDYSIKKITSYEKDIIHKALKSNNGNITATAKELGIARNTLYRKIIKFNIDY